MVDRQLPTDASALFFRLSLIRLGLDPFLPLTLQHLIFALNCLLHPSVRFVATEMCLPWTMAYLFSRCGFLHLSFIFFLIGSSNPWTDTHTHDIQIDTKPAFCLLNSSLCLFLLFFTVSSYPAVTDGYKRHLNLLHFLFAFISQRPSTESLTPLVDGMASPKKNSFLSFPFPFRCIFNIKPLPSFTLFTLYFSL